MFFLELQFKQEYAYRCLTQPDNNSTEVSLGLAVCDLINQMAHQYSGVSGEGCSLHLFGLQCLDLLCALVQTEGLFSIYRSKKQVLLNQVQSTLCIPIFVSLLNNAVKTRDTFHQP